MHALLETVLQLHTTIREAVVEAMESTDMEMLSRVSRDDEGDTIYAIDEISETLVLECFSWFANQHHPVILVAEGIEGGRVVLPAGAKEDDAPYVIIVDPIDGTRGLMYQKRSAWILTGIAPNKSHATNLRDITVAVQTEIPTIKQYLCDQLWTGEDGIVHASRYNRITQSTVALKLQPSRARTIAHGFATISRFFPGVREELARIDEEIVAEALGPVVPDKALCYEDQYISTGGQLYELMAGHDRFVADIRPLMEPVINQRGLSLGICCHPYDICTELIARRLGVIVTDEFGEPLSAKLNVNSDVSWAGYANERIQQQVQPLLSRALSRRNLI